MKKDSMMSITNIHYQVTQRHFSKEQIKGVASRLYGGVL